MKYVTEEEYWRLKAQGCDMTNYRIVVVVPAWVEQDLKDDAAGSPRRIHGL